MNDSEPFDKQTDFGAPSITRHRQFVSLFTDDIKPLNFFFVVAPVARVSFVLHSNIEGWLSYESIM